MKYSSQYLQQKPERENEYKDAFDALRNIKINTISAELYFRESAKKCLKVLNVAYLLVCRDQLADCMHLEVETLLWLQLVKLSLTYLNRCMLYVTAIYP